MTSLQPGDRVDGRFEIEAVLGEGGLARVYRVRHLDLGSTFALKMLLLRKRELAERLIVEGRIQAQLRHPNIVAVVDLVRHEGQFGLLMEYVDHQTLEHYLDRRGALSLREGLEILAPVCSAVAAAHDAGITHRDLKPANVMLAQTARGLVPKVADFGIAKVVDESALSGSGSGRLMGTPGYLAPEQITDSAGVDERADIFALGAIAWRVFAGRNAYQDDEGVVSIQSTMSDARPLQDYTSGIPPHVAVAIHRALARDRDERFPDVRMFAAALLRDHPDLFEVVDREPTGDRSITLEGVARTVNSITSISGSFPTGGRAGGQTLIAVGTSSMSDVPAAPLALAPEPSSRVGPWAVGIALLGILVALGFAAVGIVAVGGVLLAWPEPPPEVVRLPEPPPPIAAPPPPEVAIAEPEPAVAPVPVEPTPMVTAPVAVPEPEVPVPEPVPAVPEVEPAVAEVEPPEPAPAPAPPPAPPAPRIDLGGSWTGKANNVPFTLVVVPGQDGAVGATGTFQLGATTQNVALAGTFDGTVLALDGGGFTFSATVSGRELIGTYRRGKGKDLPW